MTGKQADEAARDPQDLARLLVSHQRAGDADGMAALYEPDAILDCGSGHWRAAGMRSALSMPVSWRAAENSNSAISAQPS